MAPVSVTSNRQDDTEREVEPRAERPVAAIETVAFTSLDELRAEARIWDACVAETGSDIYFTVDWIETWWRSYGDGQQLVCLLIRRNGAPIAALPFCHRRVWLGPLPLRVACFVGAQHTLTVFRPAISAEHEAEALAAAVRYLTEIGCDMVSLSPLSGESETAEALERGLEGDVPAQVLVDSETKPHMFFDLPDAFDDYVASLGRRSRKTLRRTMRLADEEHGLSAQVPPSDEALASFERFVELHAEQWREAGLPGHFGDWPGAMAFNRALVERMAKTGRVQFDELVRDGEVVASQYSFVFGDTCFCRLSGRRVGEEYDALSLGIVGQTKMIESMIDQGVSKVDEGPGSYDYKRKSGAQELPMRRLIAVRDSLRARLASRLLVAWSNLVDLGYYRIWRRRVLPKIGLKPGGLWRVWIRTRFLPTPTVLACSDYLYLV